MSWKSLYRIILIASDSCFLVRKRVKKRAREPKDGSEPSITGHRGLTALGMLLS
jgi:hypothetical protein